MRALPGSGEVLMLGEHIAVRERDDAGFELFLDDDAKNRLARRDNLGFTDAALLRHIARQVYFTDAEAYAVAQRVKEALYGRDRTQTAGDYDAG